MYLLLQNSQMDNFKEFAQKVESMRLQKEEEMNVIAQRMGSVKVCEKITFAVINRTLRRT